MDVPAPVPGACRQRDGADQARDRPAHRALLTIRSRSPGRSRPCITCPGAASSWGSDPGGTPGSSGRSACAWPSGGAARGRDHRGAPPAADGAGGRLRRTYYRFEHVTIEPLLPRFREFWVGGGSKVKTALSPDPPTIAPAVLARIASADGWLARAAGTDQLVKDDVRAIRAYLREHGRDPDSLRYGHLNFAHLVDTDDRDRALRIQRPLFERVMGTHRSFEQLRQSYFLGTTREIVARIAGLEAAGIQDMVLATVDDDLEQLERFASEIVPRFARG